LGRIVELAAADEVYHRPLHPYTKALISAVPVPDPTAQRERILLEGDLPSPLRVPSGCRFHTRCPLAEASCRENDPVLEEVAPGHQIACPVVARGLRERAADPPSPPPTAAPPAE
ncbi:MAG: ABC transporter ATP-binding protein, partial [Myxococcales bacterium]|nr:ABC transporter ATP-binding protein [Myxococcales bacterium]